MAYFRYFQTLAYDLRGVENNEQFDNVTNILARVLIRQHGWPDVDGSPHDVLIGACELERYFVQDSDRPDTLAYQFYGDSELHWLILYVNGGTMVNPYYDWPLTYFDLMKFVDKKYGAANRNAVHHYEDANNYQVDSDAPIADAVTNVKHEEILNDSKRLIRILQQRHVGEVVDEFKKLLSTQ